MRGEVRFGSDHVRGVVGATRGSSARGRGRRCLSRGGMVSQRAVSLDMTWRSFEAGGAY